MENRLKLIAVLLLGMATVSIVALLSKAHEDNDVAIEIDKPDMSKLTIRGLKPKGSSVVLFANYHIGGPKCDKYSFSALDMKEHLGGSEYVEYTKSQSSSPTEYKYSIIYQPYEKNECKVTLDYIKIVVNNKVDDTGGFAEINISNLNNYDETIFTNPLAEAKDCRTNKGQYNNGQWHAFVSCDFYVNGSLMEKDVNSNYRLGLDFSKLNEKEELVYNIIAGTSYNDGVLDIKTGTIK